MSKALEIGNKLVEMCREGKNVEFINEHYADNIVSVEAAAGPGADSRIIEGKPGVLGKSEWWFANHEIHDAKVEGPWPNGDDKFAVRFTYDVTNKQMNMRMNMDEIAVYTLNGGKIAREEFYYNMG